MSKLHAASGKGGVEKMRYIPQVIQVEKWRKHFRDMANGLVHPQNEHFSLETRSNQTGGGEEYKFIELVTPTAQTVERAKAELKRDELEEPGVAGGVFVERKMTSSKGKRKRKAIKAVMSGKKITTLSKKQRGRTSSKGLREKLPSKRKPKGHKSKDTFGIY